MRSPAAPREVRVLERLGSALRPPQAGSIPSVRSPASRQALRPSAPRAGLGALSWLARGCSCALVGHRGSPAWEALATAVGQRGTACAGRKFPQLQRGSEVCVPNFPRFQTERFH